MITKPVLILDEQKCRNNIRKMARKAEKNGLIFRPHFKTHQSLEIGRWFKESNVSKITVSSLSMAEYFSEEWDDITVAFPVNILEMDAVNSLSQRITLNLLVESEETVLFLEKHASHHLGLFIKIDTGYNRTGLLPGNSSRIEKILEVVAASQHLKFLGFLSHSGHTYHCRETSEVLRIHDKSVRMMENLKREYLPRFPELIVSLGDTPSCCAADSFGRIDEIRPGNFVFYDLMQHQIGSAPLKDIAVAMVCPVVAIHPERNEIIIYGGGVHFSKESLKDEDYGVIFGKAVHPAQDSWGDLIPEMYIKAVSQEHGIVHAPDREITKCKIGDCLFIIPVHSCMTAHEMGFYQTTGGRRIERL